LFNLQLRGGGRHQGKFLIARIVHWVFQKSLDWAIEIAATHSESDLHRLHSANDGRLRFVLPQIYSPERDSLFDRQDYFCIN